MSVRVGLVAIVVSGICAHLAAANRFPSVWSVEAITYGGGYLSATSRPFVYAASNSEVYAIATDIGQIVATQDTAIPLFASLALSDDESVVFAQGRSSTAAFNATNLAVLWNSSTGIPGAPFPGRSRPLHIPSCNRVLALGLTHVLALNGNNGSLAWYTKMPNPSVPLTNDYTVRSPTLLPGSNIVVFGTATGSVLAVDGCTGVILWQVPVGLQCDSPVALDDTNDLLITTVMNSNSTSIVALHQSDHTVAWNVSQFTWNTAAVSVQDGIIYGATEMDVVYSLNATDGSVLWSFPYPDTVNTPAPVLIGPYVVVGTTGALILERATGKPVFFWRGKAIIAPPNEGWSFTMVSNIGKTPDDQLLLVGYGGANTTALKVPTPL